MVIKLVVSSGITRKHYSALVVIQIILAICFKVLTSGFLNFETTQNSYITDITK